MKKLLFLLLLTQSIYTNAQVETFVTPNGKKVQIDTTPHWNLDGNSNNAEKSIGTKDAFDLPFETNGIEKMRIAKNGNVGIGTSTPAANLHIVAPATVTKPTILVTSHTGSYSGDLYNGSTNPSFNGVGISALGYIESQRKENANLFLSKPSDYDTNNPFFVQFIIQGKNTVGTISTDGSKVAYNTTSDRRLKENIVSSHYGLADVMKMKIYDYNYISDSSKIINTGVLAQELYKVFPQAVTVGGTDEKLKPWMVDYSKIVPVLTNAIQEQQTEIENQKNELKDKDNELKALKLSMQKLEQAVSQLMNK